ncbi:MAG: hypothetical protein LBQ58_06140 [Synergistaceae bacterium]|jgi:hypothetical protein|nr:hypothetical protein [Synergistaceae bacterium]
MSGAKRRRWKGYLLLFSILCGVLYFAEERYRFFRLRDLEIAPWNVLPDHVIWQQVPEAANTFWPSLLFQGRTFTRSITNYYPVDLKLQVVGWGRYRVSVLPLDVFLGVSWNSKLWWLSTSKRMWRADLPSSASVKGLKFPNRPILSWDADLAMPIDPEKQMGDVYPSSLPLSKIAKWYKTIEKIGWNEDIYCLLAKKIDGRPVVQILLGSEERVTGEIIVKDDASDWLSLAAALEKIYPVNTGGMPPGLIINATFTGMRFTVTNRGIM